jgi:gamma-glutamylcyclotransferase (GGCT)/AIG2-like uncharacterized protein YtfP
MSVKTKRGTAQLPFFVYGTLIPGQPNAAVWGQEIVSNARASLANCQLYDLGYYPMLVEGRAGEVQGVLITLRATRYHDVLRLIDALEGYDPSRPGASAYKRVIRVVGGPDGTPVRAWVYVGEAGHVTEDKLIVGGSWPEHVSAAGADLETWWRGVSTIAGWHGSAE